MSQIIDGKYQIICKLSQGGMGAVYEAKNLETARRVAIKVIAGGLLEKSPDATARFKREAKATGALETQHVAQVLDAGRDSATGDPYIVMELLTGEDLKQLIRRIGPLAPDVALRVVAQACIGLKAAHEAGVIHRDIKPANLFLARRDGGEIVLKIVDFGIAKVISEPEPTGDKADLTHSGLMLGSPRYSSPEQARGQKSLDHRTDLWSLGVVLYELLCGQTPFHHAESVVELMMCICSQPAPQVRDFAPWIPAAHSAIVDRALKLDPKERFASAAEMLDAVNALLPNGTSIHESMLAPRPAEPMLPSTKADSSQRPGLSGATSAGTPLNTSTLPPETSRKPRAAWVGASVFVAAMLMLGGGLVARRYLRVDAASLESSASSAQSSSIQAARPSAATAMPTAVTDLPAPRSESQDAIAAYRRGLVALRVGGQPGSDLERAVELDPSLAEAHLQFAAIGHVDEPERDHLRKAEELRAALAPRDQALLDALAPILKRQPSDWQEAIRRLSAAVERFPHDAQLWCLLGVWKLNAFDIEGSVQAYDNALAEDPGYAEALGYKGYSFLYLGRLAEAKQILETCLRLSPKSLPCSRYIGFILTQEGSCEELERLARGVLAAGGGKASAYNRLAVALAAQGKPIAAVREAQKQGLEHAPEAARKELEIENELRSAVWAGDFEAAEHQARALDQEVQRSTRRDERSYPIWRRVQILEETGRKAEAGRVAMDLLDRQDAWEPDPRAEDYAVARDYTPGFLAAAERAGLISRRDFESRRGAWLASWESKLAPGARSYLWFQGYAMTTETEVDARAALDALPRYGPIAPLRPLTLSYMGLGPAYLLSGRVEEAVSWLGEVTKACNGYMFPIEHTHAFNWLGQALEAKGDKEGACAAYQGVLSRWGQAKPRSVTADRARERRRALRCKEAR